MSDQKRSRGRPKGSGIDDHEKLLEIGRLIQCTPGLKPTTAIRQLGHADPSTIRRLRDKYNVEQDAIRGELLGLPAAHQLNDNTSFRLPTEAARQSLLRTTDAIRRSPKDVLRNTQTRANKRNELSCLLAIGAHALAQAAAYYVETDDDAELHDGTDSQALLAEMLFMMSNPRGDETNAR
ncbi:MAG: hypothetical protein ACI89J_001063 [Hyphomicrobiaceae bacterium]|jgi:hypothetical protein